MPRRDEPGFADVSVVIPAYQAASTVERALASIAAQTCKPREAVVVDDGSTDGTAEVARAFAPEMKGIELRVVRTEDNRGAGAARNRAIAESTRPILAFLDADDEWLPEKLARSLARLDEGDYVLVTHDYWTGEGDAARHHHCERRFREYPDPFVGLYRKGYIPSCSVVTRREAVAAAGGFDEGLRSAQDFDLWLAMLREPGTPFLVFGEPLLRYYHATPGGIMSHTRRRLRCGLAIAVRYYPDLRSRSGSALVSLWFRVVALHLEAIQAYWDRGGVGGLLMALKVICQLPVRLLTTTLASR
ncbi:MAG: glycosyltransferase family 2 protein, partial [Rhodospirillales bacterium]